MCRNKCSQLVIKLQFHTVIGTTGYLQVWGNKCKTLQQWCIVGVICTKGTKTCRESVMAPFCDAWKGLQIQGWWLQTILTHTTDKVCVSDNAAHSSDLCLSVWSVCVCFLLLYIERIRANQTSCLWTKMKIPPKHDCDVIFVFFCVTSHCRLFQCHCHMNQYLNTIIYSFFHFFLQRWYFYSFRCIII